MYGPGYELVRTLVGIDKICQFGWPTFRIKISFKDKNSLHYQAWLKLPTLKSIKKMSYWKGVLNFDQVKGNVGNNLSITMYKNSS